MILGIDHIALAVRDLDTATADYEKILGRAADWRGHAGGARHSWFQLDNLALDLVSPGEAGQLGNGVSQRLQSTGEGIWAIGFAVHDLDAASKIVERRGVGISPPIDLVSTRADGETRSWRYSNLATSSTGGSPIFLVQQSDQWRRTAPAGSAEISALDHIVINTANADRAMAFYGARLGLDLRLDRSNEKWGSRLLFFRCGDLVVEIGAKLNTPPSDAPDGFGGLAWRVKDGRAAHARLAAAGCDVSELRAGRKPGTHVFTVRSRTANVPTLVLEPSPRE